MKRSILILIWLCIFLIGCTVVEQEMTDDKVMVKHFFAPGYESFDKMVEASDVIIRAYVLDERVELVNTNITLEAAIEERTKEYETGLISREEFDKEIEHYHNHIESFEPSYWYVIFYRVEILEIFQGKHEVGEVIEVIRFMGGDEEENPSLEHSARYEVDTELVFFLRSGRLGYLALFPHQSVYEVPAESRYEAGGMDEMMLLEPLSDFQLEPLESSGGYIIIYEGDFGPFDVNLYMLREIAKRNNLSN